MIPTPTEPIVNHLGPVDGVCLQYYPVAYAHLSLSCCFKLEPSTLFLYYNRQTTKRYCQFCFEKLDRHSKFKIVNFYSMAFHHVNWNAYT